MTIAAAAPTALTPAQARAVRLALELARAKLQIRELEARLAACSCSGPHLICADVHVIPQHEDVTSTTAA